MTYPVLLSLLSVVTLWVISALCTLYGLIDKHHTPRMMRIGLVFLSAGNVLLALFTIWLWVHLGRPPMRTLGETRLWYALLLPAIGILVEWRLKTRSLRLPMLFFGLLFVILNLLHPEAMDRTLMPALQSPWFIPHVVVYMVSYAALGLSCGAAISILLRRMYHKEPCVDADAKLPDLLVRLGLPFLTMGLVFGALWAKEAWGHYWTWDPKETWAFLTWAAYVIVLHLERDKGPSPRTRLLLTIGSFAVVLACWFLVNYLPAASISVHTYTQ